MKFHNFDLPLNLIMPDILEKYEAIAGKVRAGGRITPEEALVMWNDAPLALLGELACGIKREKSGDKLYWNRNFHIEPTNICVFNCRFCSYRKGADSPEAWNMSLDDIEATAERYADSGVTEVHIVGGVHPDHDLMFYVEMVRRVKSILPKATVKAFTAIELAHIIDMAGISFEHG